MCAKCAKDAAALKSAQQTLDESEPTTVSRAIKKSAQIINEYRKFMLHWAKLITDFTDELDKSDMTDDEKTAVLSGFNVELTKLAKEYDK
jgi:hypothetical protein